MIRYSEIFASFQGEGCYTGRPTIFFRFWACNLKCAGFSQKDPFNPSTWELPYEKVDFTKYERLEDLPVFEKGCDSAYSWNPKFKKFMKKASIGEAVDEIIRVGKEGFGLTDAHFSTHPKTGNPIMLCFTGGEPMLYQQEMLDIVGELRNRGIAFDTITVETNGTRDLEVEFPPEFLFSISPKLRAVSGEIGAVKPQVIDNILQAYPGWIKVVANGDPRCWGEIDGLLGNVKFRGNFWVMPVGATVEQQNNVAKIAEEALKRGFKVASRAHCYIFGNRLGT